MRSAYLALCVLGILLPYAAFGPWLFEHGLALHLLVHEVAGSPVAAFAWADVLVSAAALLAFMAREHRARPVRYAWVPVIGLLCVGVSLALPLYLYLRETQQSAA
jgi:hypothetical protein